MIIPEKGDWLTDGNAIFQVTFVDDMKGNPDNFHLTGVGIWCNGFRHNVSIPWPNDRWRRITYNEAQEELALFVLADL
jgi:hypothetical protein